MTADLIGKHLELPPVRMLAAEAEVIFVDVNHLMRHARHRGLQGVVMLRADLDDVVFLLALDRDPMEGLIVAGRRAKLHEVGVR